MGVYELQLLHALEMLYVGRQACRDDSLSPTPAELLQGSPGAKVNANRLQHAGPISNSLSKFCPIESGVAYGGLHALEA